MKLRVRIKPNAKKEELLPGGTGDFPPGKEPAFIVCVKEPPREGKANEALCRIVGKHFGVPASAVRVVAGKTGRDKILEIN